MEKSFTALHTKIQTPPIEHILEANDLVRVSVISEKGLEPLISKYGIASVYDRCLRLSLRNTDYFSRIPLAWHLYLLTESAYNSDIRTMLEIIIDERIDHFFANFFPYPDCRNYYYDALEILKDSRLSKSTTGYVRYTYPENAGRYVIFPRALQGCISEEHLYARLNKRNVEVSTPGGTFGILFIHQAAISKNTSNEVRLENDTRRCANS